MRQDGSVTESDRQDAAGLLGREWIEGWYLPRLSGRVLWVGVNADTPKYQQLVRQPERFESIDVSERVASLGSNVRHYVGDFLRHKPSGFYDHIGVYGLDEKYTPKGEVSWVKWSSKLLKKADRMLRPGGTILFGGNVTRDWARLRGIVPIVLYREKFCRSRWVDGRLVLKWWIEKP